MSRWTRADLADLHRRTAVLVAQVRAAQHRHDEVAALAGPVAEAGQAAYAAGYEAGQERQHAYDQHHVRELGD